MKIKICDTIKNEDILDGTYEYLEGGKTDGFPSFHISFGKGEVFFYCEDEKELDELIKNLQEIKEEQ